MYKLIVAITIFSMVSCHSNLNKLVFNKVAELKEQHKDEIKPILQDTLKSVGTLMVQGGMCVQNLGAGLLVVDDAVQHWGQWGKDLFDGLFAALYEEQAWEKFCAPLFNSTSIEKLLKIPFEHKKLFSTFKSDHGKTYENLSEEGNRLVIFSQNLQYINEFNSQDNDMTLGVNQFADLTHEEFKTKYIGGIIPEEQLNALDESNIPDLDESNNAASIDWTTKGAVNTVKNQGGCGSCWAFSAVAAMETAYFLKYKQLLSFSEQQLVDCAGKFNNHGCHGGFYTGAWRYVEGVKMDTESKYKYTGRQSGCMAGHHGPGIFNVKSYYYKGKVTVSQMEAMVSQTVVSIAIEADQSAFQFYKSGIVTGTCGTHVDHGVAVVGYGTAGGKDFWKVRNSWGPGWGEGGYVRILKSSANKCGVISMPAYPIL